MVNLTQNSINKLIDLVYQAGMEPDRWLDFINELDKQVDGASLAIYGQDTLSDRATIHLTTRFSDEYVDSYATHFAGLNPYPPAFLKKNSLKVYHSDELVPHEKMIKTEFYNDWLYPQDDIGTGAGCMLYNDESRLLLVTGQVRICDDETVTPRLIEMLGLLVPHICRAFEMHRALKGMALSQQSYVSALDSVRNSVFLLGRDCRVFFANAAATATLARHEGIWQCRFGQLQFTDTKAFVALRQALGRIVTSGHDPSRSSFVLNLSEEHRVAATLDPLSLDVLQESFGWGPWLMTAPEPCALLVLQDVDLDCDASRRHLANLYGLTLAEQHVAVAIAEGANPATIAAKSQLSVHTLRNQLKAIFEKTGLSSQSQLTELVNRLAFRFKTK